MSDVLLSLSSGIHPRCVFCINEVFILEEEFMNCYPLGSGKSLRYANIIKKEINTVHMHPLFGILYYIIGGRFLSWPIIHVEEII